VQHSDLSCCVCYGRALQKTDVVNWRKLVDSICQLEHKTQTAVTALPITAAKLLLTLCTHILLVIPKPQGGKQSARQKWSGLGSFIRRLPDASDIASISWSVFTIERNPNYV
jgi:hypothetical protein